MNRKKCLWLSAFDVAAKAGDWLAYCIMTILGVEVTLRECRERQSRKPSRGILKRLDFPKTPGDDKADEVLKYCECMLQEAKTRHSSINDKSKILLTILTFTSGLILGLLSYTKGAGAAQPLFTIPAFFACLGLFFLLFYYGLSKYQTLSLTQDEIGLPVEKIRISRAKSMHSSAEHLDCVSNFLGNVYIAARHSLIIAWVSLVVLGFYGALSSAGKSEEDQLSQMIMLLEKQMQSVENERKSLALKAQQLQQEEETNKKEREQLDKAREDIEAKQRALNQQNETPGPEREP